MPAMNNILPTKFGRNEIHSLLGEGGMGRVYLAQDTTLRRPVAVKLLATECVEDHGWLQRFEREALAVSSLNHPNILTIYEVGEENGHRFIATEYVDGESLRQSMNSRLFEIREILDIGIQVAAALAEAHQAGIIHRDIKPENVMSRHSDGLAKVLDFGLAKFVERKTSCVDQEAPTELMRHDTAPGLLMGTIQYMSPEQTRGYEVDARTDVWSTGVLLYEMFTNRLPFAGETTCDIIAAILMSEPPVVNARLHESEKAATEFMRIVAEALRKNREERYQTMADLGRDLKRLRQQLEFEAELARSGAIKWTAKLKRINKEIQTTLHAPARQQLLPALVLMILLTIVSFAYVARTSWFNRSERIGAVAVMPFTNENDQHDAQHLSESISENLIDDLARHPTIKVSARSSSFRYKDVDPRLVAQALGAETIVTGTVVQLGDDLLIKVELVNANEGTRIWGDHYNVRGADLQKAQCEIAGKIAEQLYKHRPSEIKATAYREHA